MDTDEEINACLECGWHYSYTERKGETITHLDVDIHVETINGSNPVTIFDWELHIETLKGKYSCRSLKK